MIRIIEFNIFLLIITGSPFLVNGQNNADRKIDSLKKIIRTAQHDSVKVNAYKYWDELIYYNNPDLDKKINLNIISICEKNLSKKSIEEKTKRYFKNELAWAYSNVGNFLEAEGRYAESINYYFKSLRLHEELKSNVGLAAVYSNIGALFKVQGSSEKSLEYFNLAYKHDLLTGDSVGIAGSLMNLGVWYNEAGKNDDAMLNFKNALSIYLKTNKDPWTTAAAYNNIGSVFTNLKQPDSAYIYYNKSLQIRLQIGDQRVIAGTYFNIAGVYHDKGNYNEALKFFQKSLDESTAVGFLEMIKLVHQGMAKTYEAKGDFKNAFEAYKKHIVFRDSLINEENTKKTIQTQMQYAFDKKEAATKAAQEKKDAITKAEKERQQIILFLVGGVLILVVLFSFIIFRNLRKTKKQKAIIETQKKEVEEQKILVEEKQKEILDSIRYAKRIQMALLPSEKYMERNIQRSSN